MKKGSLHIIPTPLAEDAVQTLPVMNHTVIRNVKIWYVENLRSARRFLKQIDKQFDIDACTFYELSIQNEESLQYATSLFEKGNGIGLLSECGCPGIADPGSKLVKIAHQMHADVIPYVGPNSIVLAIMSSGFTGQSFRFHGYLPNKQPSLRNTIKEIEKESKERNISQFFIETPYRNNSLLHELIECANAQTKISIACDLTSAHQEIVVASAAEWRKKTINFHKRPAVFGLYAGNE